MDLPFTKMHGLGNDFVVIDAIRHPVDMTPDLVRSLADRRFGVGCDQVLIVDPAEDPQVDFGYRIFNADGGQVEQCGNGARCFARFVRDQGHTQKDEIVVQTLSGIIRPRIRPDGQVTVDMGEPVFDPPRIPFDAQDEADAYSLEVAGRTIGIGAVSMGNPHAVMVVDEVDDFDVSGMGPLVESHQRFPQRVNAGFMQIINPGHIRLRVYERGAGETLACGTGACAAVAVGHRQGLLGDRVLVDVRGGRLEIEWSGPGGRVMMTGPAERVFQGTVSV